MSTQSVKTNQQEITTHYAAYAATALANLDDQIQNPSKYSLSTESVEKLKKMRDVINQKKSNATQSTGLLDFKPTQPVSQIITDFKVHGLFHASQIFTAHVPRTAVETLEVDLMKLRTLSEKIKNGTPPKLCFEVKPNPLAPDALRLLGCLA